MRLAKARTELLGDLILAATATAVAAIYFSYIETYFFLFDDFALIGQASSAERVFSQPLFGFYRPLVFLLVRGEARVFGWSSPGGYIAVSQAWHLANVALLFLLVKQLGQSTRAAAIAGLLFLLSPWSSEAYFWLSARFDVLATFGVLACLVFGVAMIDSAGHARRSALGLAGVIAGAFGVFAKENAIVLPALAAATFLIARPREALRRFAPWAYIAVLLLLVATYLVVRNRVLPHFGSSYGEASTLFDRADLVANGLSYVAAFVAIPFPGILAGERPHPFVTIAAVLVLLVLTWQAWRAARRLVVLCAIAFLLTLAPVLWLAMPIASSAGGRLRYLPGVWFALLVGAGLGRVVATAREPHSRRRALAFSITLTAVFVPSLVSVYHQSHLWQHATKIARSSIEQFRQLLNQPTPQVYVPDFPFWFAEGPYVLKDYAFGYYFSGIKVPSVRTRNMVLSARNGETTFAGWVEPTATPVTSDERLFELELPVSGIPASLSVDPKRVSLFVSCDGRQSSGAGVSLSGQAIGAWRIENPAPEVLDVQPMRGSGPATLRLEGRRIMTGVHQEVPVHVFSGFPDGLPEATFTVKVEIPSCQGE